MLIGRPGPRASSSTPCSQDAGAADLLVGPDLVGRVRDGGGAGRPRRRLALRRPSRAADLGRDRGCCSRSSCSRTRRACARMRRAAARTSSRGRTWAPCPRSSPAAALLDRLRADRRGLGGGRRLRDHLGRAVARAAPARPVPRVRRRCSRSGTSEACASRGSVRVPDLRVHPLAVPDLGVGVAKCTVGTCPRSRPCRTRSPAGRRARRSSCC